MRRRLLLFFILPLAVLALSYPVLTYVYPPATSRSGCIQQLRVGGTTLSACRSVER